MRETTERERQVDEELDEFASSDVIWPVLVLAAAIAILVLLAVAFG